MKRVASIILNRNIPTETDLLVEHIKEYDGELTDIYVVEAGSDDDKLSGYCTWHVNDEVTRKQGLRYSRGMNYGLFELWKSGRFKNYDAFFLLTNDTVFERSATLAPLLNILDSQEYIGILSPCSMRWGERLLLQDQPFKYFWFIHNNAYLLRRGFIELICRVDADYTNFLFDGTNFRGYGSESELIAKAYANDWAAAISRDVSVDENECLLREKANIIKTEQYEDNLKLYVAEGLKWMKDKYGFRGRWVMQQYVRFFYDKFFEFHPELIKYRI
jgi:hypothetical protein